MLLLSFLASVQSFKQHLLWNSTTLLLVSTFTITFFFIAFFLRKTKVIPNLPPSPRTLPLLGNLHQLGRLPHRSLQSLSKKYGPLMLLHFGRLPTIIISSAELACEVMKTHDLVFASRPDSSMGKKLLYDSQDVAFAPYGEYWRQVRRICVIHLLSIKMVQSFRSIREEEASIFVERIRSSSGLVNLSEMIITLTNDVICRVAFGRKYAGGEGEGGKRFRELLAEFLELLGSFPAREFIPKFGWLDRLSGLDARVRKNHEEFDDFLEAVLEEHAHGLRYASDDHKDFNNFVDVLLSLDPKDEMSGNSLNKDHVKALILDMFAAGTDTTFTALEWTMAELLRNPDVMKRAEEEVRGVTRHKGKIIEEDLERMTYLKAVIKEALRLHPPFPLLVPRETRENIELQGCNIPARTRVVINAWAIGRDPRSWERPEEFWPDRFISSNIDFSGQNFQFIPFGAGRRGCPGIAFATSVIELTLANLLLHFDWELPNGTKGEELDMTESPGVTPHRKSSLVLVAKPVLP